MKRLAHLIALVAMIIALLLPASTAARQAEATPPGITTVGYGHASAPGASANLQFLIMYNYFYGGAPAAGPVIEATPGAQVRSLLEPIAEQVQAIEGVESVTVVIPIIPTYQKDPNILARLDVTLASPTQDSLVGLYTQVSQLALDNRLMIGYVGVAFTAEDCQALEQEARQAALDDARMRAGIQAELLNATLGDIVASEDIFTSDVPTMTAYGAVPQTGGACDPPTASSSALGQLYPGITQSPFDPSVESGEVHVYRQLRVSFEVLPAT